MAFIATIEKKCGKFKINFLTRHGVFEIHYPNQEVKEKYFGCESGKQLLTWQDVTNELDRIDEAWLHQEKFIRKIIVIDLQTSAKIQRGTVDESPSGIKLKDNSEKLHRGTGFIIDWCVAEEFEWYDKKKRYRIIEHNGKFADRKDINIFPQIFFFYGSPRTLDYSPELYQFLLNMEVSVENILQKLVSFFDKDSEKFLDNIRKSNLQLSLNQ